MKLDDPGRLLLKAHFIKRQAGTEAALYFVVFYAFNRFKRQCSGTFPLLFSGYGITAKTKAESYCQDKNELFRHVKEIMVSD
ncbi:hypothetical protein D3C85_885340 [compost metagenome]